MKSRHPRIEVNFFSKCFENAENGFTARSCFQNAPFSFSVDVGSSSTGGRPLGTPLWEMLGDEKAGRELGGSQGVLPPSRGPPVGGSLGASRELGDGPCMAQCHMHHRSTFLIHRGSSSRGDAPSIFVTLHDSSCVIVTHTDASCLVVTVSTSRRRNASNIVFTPAVSRLIVHGLDAYRVIDTRA